MKIYTRGGDGGQTSMVSGGRLWKSDIRVRLLGECDELNAAIGLALSLWSVPANTQTNQNHLSRLKTELQGQQCAIFELGAVLAGSRKSGGANFPTEKSISQLEESIDSMDAALPPLRAFILPGGDPGASALHFARTITRRLERSLVFMSEEMPDLKLSKLIFAYVNRLSDYLFVAARMANWARDIADPAWKSGS